MIEIFRVPEDLGSKKLHIVKGYYSLDDIIDIIGIERKKNNLRYILPRDFLTPLYKIIEVPKNFNSDAVYISLQGVMLLITKFRSSKGKKLYFWMRLVFDIKVNCNISGLMID